MRDSLKNIADDIRLIVIYRLALLIMNLAPRNAEGVEWMVAIHDVSRRLGRLSETMPA